MRDTTGAVIAGPLARRTRGCVVAVVEEFERLGPMLKAAQRLATVTGGDVKLTLVGDRRDELAWMEGEARLLCADGDDGEIGNSRACWPPTKIPRPWPRCCSGKAGLCARPVWRPPDRARRQPAPAHAVLDCPLLLVR